MTDRWHVGKEIPLALIGAVLVQTAGGIWWMAQLSSKLDVAVTTISELKNERYTQQDYRRDRLLLDQQFQSMTNADRELDRRMSAIENRMDRQEVRSGERPR